MLLDEYLANATATGTMNALQAGKARAALIRLMRFDGTVHKRHAYAELISTRPGVKVDVEKQRVYTGKLVDGAYDGAFYEFGTVTKAFADYLQWLLARQGFKGFAQPDATSPYLNRPTRSEAQARAELNRG